MAKVITGGERVKVQVTTAADIILKYFYYYCSEKTKLGTCISYHVPSKWNVGLFFLSENNKKKLDC